MNKNIPIVILNRDRFHPLREQVECLQKYGYNNIIVIDNYSTYQALLDWYKTAKKSDWNNYAELKNTFNSADNVGNNRYVFNIKGNNYRIVAIVRFNINRVFIRWVGNHKDYDKLNNIDKPNNT